MKAALRKIADGRVDVESLISDRNSLDDLLPHGLHRLEEHRADTMKILVAPGA